MALGADDVRNYLLHGNFDPSEGCSVSLRALQKAAIPAQNFNGDALQRHMIISHWQETSVGPAQHLPSQLNFCWKMVARIGAEVP